MKESSIYDMTFDYLSIEHPEKLEKAMKYLESIHLTDEELNDIMVVEQLVDINDKHILGIFVNFHNHKDFTFGEAGVGEDIFIVNTMAMYLLEQMRNTRQHK